MNKKHDMLCVTMRPKKLINSQYS